LPPPVGSGCPSPANGMNRMVHTKGWIRVNPRPEPVLLRGNGTPQQWYKKSGQAKA
jgi:hypothetical protein